MIKHVIARFSIGIVSAIVLVTGAWAATDGTFWLGVNFKAANWSEPRYWLGGVQAADGGIFTYSGSQINSLTVDLSGVTLGGMDFGPLKRSSNSYTAAIMGKDITLVGSPFLSGTAATGPDIKVKLTGDGTAPLVKRGGGSMFISTPVENFTKVRIEGGALMSYAASGVAVANLPIELANGALALKATGSDALSPVFGSSVTAVSGVNSLTVDKGSAPSATMYLASFAASNGAMTLVSASDLGNTEKVLVSSGFSMASANGMLDPAVLVRSGTALAPAAYDAENGFVKASVVEVELNLAGDGDFAVVTNSTMLNESKSVAALKIEGNSGLSIPSDKTLTVTGAGGNALVLLKDETFYKGGTTPTISLDGGELAFGNRHGIICISEPDGATSSMLNLGSVRSHLRYTGTAGISFVSRNSVAKYTPNIEWDQDSPAATWTGPTIIDGVRLKVNREDNNNYGPQNPFPQTGDDNDVYIVGSYGKDGGSVTFRPRGGMCYTFSNHFHVSGSGDTTRGEGKGYAIYFRNVNGPTHTFNGRFTVEADAAIGCRAENGTSPCTVVFNGGIDGAGRLVIGADGDAVFGTFRLASAFTAPALTISNTTVQVVSGGSFGACAIKLAKNGVLELNGLDGVTIPCDISGSGVIRLVNSSVDFTGRVDETLIEADSASSYLVSGNGETVFTGEGTYDICRGYVHDVDRVVVAGGTARINPDFRMQRSVTWWLDASQPDTVVLDEQGGVACWKSANGNDAYFTNTVTKGNARYQRPGYTNSINGLSVVTYSNPTNRPSSQTPQLLTSSAKLLQRTVFLVKRCTTPCRWGGVFGEFQREYGVRESDTGEKIWDVGNFANKIYYNASTTSGNAFNTLDATEIYCLLHTDESDPEKKYANFQVSLGGGQTEHCGSDGGWRAFDGDFCEVMAYDRVLGDDERKEVMNYLAEKWGRSDLLQTVENPTDATVIPETTEVDVRAGAVLDLAGVDSVYAALTGGGTIISTGSRATLEVTGDFRFNGVIGDGVTLVIRDGQSIGCTFAAGSALQPPVGSASLLPACAYVPTEGLEYWLDADAADTITVDDGKVSAWASRSDSAKKFQTWSGTTKKGGSESGAVTGPVVTVDAVGGRTALMFDYWSSLGASAAFSPKTLVICGKVTGSQANMGGLWGYGSVGCRLDDASASAILNFYYDECYNPKGDLIRVNEADMTGKSTAQLGTDVYRFVHRASDGFEPASRNWRLNAFNGNGGMNQYVCEVLAWNRRLSDAEIAKVETYLKVKWIDGTYSDDASNISVPVDPAGGTGIVWPDGDSELQLEGWDRSLVKELKLGGGKWRVKSTAGAYVVVEGNAGVIFFFK